MVSLRTILALGSLALGARTAVAAERDVDLASFRGALIGSFQSSGGYSVAPIAAWTPRYGLTPQVSLAGDLGLTAINSSRGSFFTVVEAGALATYAVSDTFAAEGELGFQHWTGDGGNVTAPMASLYALHPFGGKGVVQAIFGGGSIIAVPKVTTYALRFGVGM